jgi:hypothetical protein
MVVIFLDILGTKKNDGFENKFKIHELFHNEVKQNEKRQLSHVVYERKIFSFSDCAYILYYYKDGIDECRKNDANLIYIATFNTTLSVLKFLSNGYLIRGGICFGEAYYDDLGFFGPAIEKAYEIESKHANYPRLMFEKRTGVMVFDWEHDPTKKDPTITAMYNGLPALCVKEGDDHYVNTFFELQKGQGLVLEDCEIDLDTIKKTAIAKIRNDMVTYKDDKNISDKLQWLLNEIISKEILLKGDVIIPLFNGIPKYE